MQNAIFRMGKQNALCEKKRMDEFESNITGNQLIHRNLTWFVDKCSLCIAEVKPAAR